MRCDGCDVDLIDLQTKMKLRALSAGEDWAEFVDRASYAISTTSPSEMGPGFMTWVHIPAVPPWVRCSVLKMFTSISKPGWARLTIVQRMHR